MKRSFDLRGAVGLVTGAASGLGASLAVALAERGCTLSLVDRDEAGIQATRQAIERIGGTASIHVLDLVDPMAIRELPDAVLAAHGRIDLLVNNAGVAVCGRFDEIDLADFDWLMDINLRAVVRMTHAFLPLLTRESRAQIVNISSIYGIIAPPGQTAYAASKFAVRGFTESLRHEFAGTGLGVTLVHPGGVATAIAWHARYPHSLDPAALAAARAGFERYLTRPPREAALEIVRSIESRAPRAIIGADARHVARLQRVMPVGYWGMIARVLGLPR